jgi:hypothetical protein
MDVSGGRVDRSAPKARESRSKGNDASIQSELAGSEISKRVFIANANIKDLRHAHHRKPEGFEVDSPIH